jgi:hypothetical protein
MPIVQKFRIFRKYPNIVNLRDHETIPRIVTSGVYVEHLAGAVRFRWVNAPTSAELTELAQRIAQRFGQYLERQGLLQRDARNSYLAGEVIDEGTMDPLWVHCIAYRIAAGPQAGRKVQTLSAGDPAQAGGAGNVGGFSLHAGAFFTGHWIADR